MVRPSLVRSLRFGFHDGAKGQDMSDEKQLENLVSLGTECMTAGDYATAGEHFAAALKLIPGSSPKGNRKRERIQAQLERCREILGEDVRSWLEEGDTNTKWCRSLLLSR